MVPDSNFKAQVYSKQLQSFVDISSDIVEQKHWQKDGKMESDYQMFIHSPIDADEILILKLLRVEGPISQEEGPNSEDSSKEQSPLSLTMMGTGENGDVLFKYINTEQLIVQTFGVNIKKYLAHQKVDLDGDASDESYDNTKEKFELENSEGALLFLPEFNNSKPLQYSSVDKNVTHHQGSLVE